ncbi:hypothetical protein MKW94_001752 [Papaver nudicaule]|uniref:R13L1/DRL21-like LRR repeat region domain-containing protein n=1 Tax=Papaver nudicaule TaxID=74823 RepID=A0AA41S0U7_PAPNU|nr:hypothetical protein [Papaver nudicaule]
MTSTSTHLPNLVRITLKNCGNCERLPAFGALKFLRYLHMEGFGGVKHIGDEFYRSNEEASNNEEARFPSLVELHITSFSNLEKWIGDRKSSSFSCLEVLEVRLCPKLSITPTEFPSLKHSEISIELLMDPNLKSLPLIWNNNVVTYLVVSRCNAFVGFHPDNDEGEQPDLSNDHLSRIDIYSCPSLTKLPAFRGLNSLTHLALEECSSIQSLPDGIQNLPALETLRIGGFSEDLVSFPFPAATGSDGEQYFVSLRELKISGWPTLRAAVLPDQLQLLTSLQCFTIRGFPCLSSLPEWFGKFSSLRTLSIEYCKKLKYLPSKEQMLSLTSLENLNIGNSPLLLERCCSGNEEWHKIAHLKQVTSSSPSLLDHITRNMNEELEALRRSGIFSNQNKEKCWTDSSGRNCFMLFPKSFNICWEHETRYWKWLSITEPSASDDAEIEVPELVDVCWLDVRGKLDISKLSPGVNYEVVFVVMFRERSYGWHIPVDLCLELPGGQRQVQKVVLESMPKLKWIEIRVGDFETPQQPGGDDQQTEINFWLFEHEVLNSKKGLVIEGAIIRPKK